MTDTTGIKALRDVKRYGTKDTGNEYFKYVTAEMTDGPWVKQEDYFSLLTMLEAERQRADDAERAGDNARSSRDLHHKVSAGLNERLIKAEAEIAALKGDQVPFAFSYNYAGCETCEGFQDWRKELSRERPPEWMLETGKVTDLVELFTAPQKLVVLPDNAVSSAIAALMRHPDSFFGDMSSAQIAAALSTTSQKS